MSLKFRSGFFALFICWSSVATQTPSWAQEDASPRKSENHNENDLDNVAKLQSDAITSKSATWGHWGNRSQKYSQWTTHANRLIPVYVFGGSFARHMNEGSVYRDAEQLRKLYGRMPTNTLRRDAPYADQTDVYKLQRAAIESLKKKYVFLVVFDGMDWDTTRCAAIYKTGKVSYNEGRGNGLLFQDYRNCETDFGYYVTAPYGNEVETDVDAQRNLKPVSVFGGYDYRLAGSSPWQAEVDAEYPIGRSKISQHCPTDSSSSATSLTAGIKAINGAVNLDYQLNQVETIARWVQRTRGFSVGTVTSVPFCHATPAAAYAHNVSRDDYQDLARDMLGLTSVSHKSKPMPGLDVVLGCGYGDRQQESKDQGTNFVPGNRFLADADLEQIDVRNGGQFAKYVVARRTSGQRGKVVLDAAAKEAVARNHRLFGFFGTKKGHLPFQTANGDFKPVLDVKDAEVYTQGDIDENPSLAQLTDAAIQVLQENSKGFWLMVEAGDVDWANHSNNIDNAIGAVLSGEAAIDRIFQWIEKRNAWDQSLVIVTSDHGHYFHLLKPEVLTTH